MEGLAAKDLLWRPRTHDDDETISAHLIVYHNYFIGKQSW